MIEPANHSEGCVIVVRAHPNAKKNGITGEHHGALKVSVTAPPQEGRANAAILEVLCEWLALKRSQVELLSGAHSRDKRFLIRGVSPSELVVKLGQLF